MPAVLGSGCGTICNLANGDPEVPLGGVQIDLQYMATPRTQGYGTGKGAAAVAVLLPVELCLSLIWDTLTLLLAIFIKRAGYAGNDHSDPIDDRSESPSGQPGRGG